MYLKDHLLSTTRRIFAQWRQSLQILHLGRKTTCPIAVWEINHQDLQNQERLHTKCLFMAIATKISTMTTDWDLPISCDIIYRIRKDFTQNVNSCPLQPESAQWQQHEITWYRKVSNISCTLVDNKIVDHSDVVGASPVGAAPTTSSFSP